MGMNGSWSYLLFYFPIAFVVCLVLQVVHGDGPVTALVRALKNVGLLTLVLLAGAVAVGWLCERVAPGGGVFDWAVFTAMAAGLFYWGWASGRKERKTAKSDGGGAPAAGQEAGGPGVRR